MSKLHYEQLLLGRYLWERVKATDYRQKESLTVLGGIGYHLANSLAPSVYTTFVFELNLWAGLKKDLADNYDEYGDRLRPGSAFFESSLRVPRISIDTSNATSPLHPELLMLGRYLWERINAVRHDAESLKVLGDITAQLVKVYDENDSGFMRELHSWIDFKKDPEANDQEFGSKIRLSYPEYFDGITIRNN